LAGGSCLDEDLARVMKRHGYRLRQVMTWRAYDDEWASDLEGALLAVRDPDLRHGSVHVAKTVKCRCIECRVLLHPPAKRAGYLERGRPYREYGAERAGANPQDPGGAA
ncbi:hypothetical protein, partial [Streptosporangium sp. NPDC023615]|uniref:hypothetical protein n=1 Tax=Streptosporangium sp. NPDC023615 TaxID=3154794 RepID=UPI00343B56F5